MVDKERQLAQLIISVGNIQYRIDDGFVDQASGVEMRSLVCPPIYFEGKVNQLIYLTFLCGTPKEILLRQYRCHLLVEEV